MSDKETLKTLKEENKQIKLLYRVSNLIHQSLDPKTALNVILQQAIELTGAHSASVSLINPTSGLLELEAAVDQSLVQVEHQGLEAVPGQPRQRAPLHSRLPDASQRVQEQQTFLAQFKEV